MDKKEIEKIDKVIEILQAFKDRKTVESKYVIGNLLEWRDVVSIDTLFSCFCNLDSIRIKKQPTYRPYANAEEFLKASKEHGPYVNNGAYNTTICEFYDTSLMLYNKETAITFEELFEDYKWSDDTPCGILEL